ncbi:MAG: glycoside hydrolase family 3 N-terminal domain-containing protein [Bacteroidales bacterium]
MKKLLIPVLFSIVPSWILCAAADKPQLGKDPIPKIVSSMTLYEKASLLVGASMDGYSGEGAVTGRTLNIVAGCAGTTNPLSQYGIPSTVMADGPAGLRIDPFRDHTSQTFYCTAFPIGTLLASTWDEEAIHLAGAAIGNEVLEYGCDVILGPGMNIHRNPLCGRNFEYFSEDPYLSGKCGAAVIKGIQSEGVGSSVKHFAANNQEGMRLQNDVRITQRALREIYLRGFEIAIVEGKPWTVMSSYNRINGPYTQENRELLTSILRDEWGYEGIVVTDWIGKRNTVAQVNAGNDLMMPGEGAQIDEIVNAVKSGKLAEKEVNNCVSRILQYLLQTPSVRGYKPSNQPDLENHARISRQVAREGMILLRNEKFTLPIPVGNEVAVFGVNAYDGIAGGTGAGHVNKAYMVNLNEGLRNANIPLNKAVSNLYEKYMSFGESLLGEQNKTRGLGEKWFVPESSLTPEYITLRAQESDLAIVSLGRISGEYNDRLTSDYILDTTERELLENVCNAFHHAGKKVIVVLNIGGVIETASWKDLPDAILLAWQGGQESGNAIADILSGKVSPSGRLPMTFSSDYMDHPSSLNFPFNYISRRGDWADDAPERAKRNLGYTFYQEDIWIGYRYFNTFAQDRIVFPFGYGLSYTDFDWSDSSIKKSGDYYDVSLRVTNSGKYAAREVVQLYVSAPESKLQKPVRELRAFVKTKELKPGESEIVSLRFKHADLASFDESISSFVAVPGTYFAELGRSVEDISIRMPFSVKSYSRKVHNVLNPVVPINTFRF